MPTTELLLVTGEKIEVAGALEDVAKELENAARSSAGALAWFDQGANDRLAVNPVHVALIRRGNG